MDKKDFLKHYGILGMRWGRRKSRTTNSSAKVSSYDESDDHKEKRLLSRKPVSEMSNAELKTFTTRLQLEKQYRDLTKVEMSKGKKIVMELLENAGKEVAKKYVAKYMDEAVASLTKKAAK